MRKYEASSLRIKKIKKIDKAKKDLEKARFRTPSSVRAPRGPKAEKAETAQARRLENTQMHVRMCGRARRATPSYATSKCDLVSRQARKDERLV